MIKRESNLDELPASNEGIDRAKNLYSVFFWYAWISRETSENTNGRVRRSDRSRLQVHLESGLTENRGSHQTK
jgi:hypothetical protein